MIKPLTTQTPVLLTWTGQLDYYRSGKAGAVVNDGDVREINGFAIDVTGTGSHLLAPSQFEPGPGIKVMKRDEMPSVLAPSTMAASLQMLTMEDGDTRWKEAAEHPPTGEPLVTAIGEVTSLIYVPTGTEPQPVDGVGFIPGDVFQKGGSAILDYTKREVARAGELAKIEKQLSADYGVDVKIAFDPLAGEYLMLRPGQPGYDGLKSGRDVFAEVVQDLPKIGNIADYRDVLAQYGVVV
jgi:hypothetical protein